MHAIQKEPAGKFAESVFAEGLMYDFCFRALWGIKTYA